MDSVLSELGGLESGILCWTNRNRCMLNSRARRVLGKKGPPRAGEILICLKNQPPVFNGMRGVLQGDVEKGSRDWLLKGKIEFPDEGLASTSYEMAFMQFMREKTLGSVDEVNEEFELNLNSSKELGSLFDFGHALTVHKSQGSQFSHAIFYMDMPEDPSNEMTRRFLYTGITRAAERLTLVM